MTLDDFMYWFEPLASIELPQIPNVVLLMSDLFEVSLPSLERVILIT